MGKHNTAKSPATRRNDDSEKSCRTYILDGIWVRVCWNGLRKRIAGECSIWRYDNTGITSLHKLGKEFAAEIVRHETVNLIGFSLGGLVVREALRLAPTAKVQRVVLINSPHRGTETARFLPFLPGCRDVMPGSAFLRRLDAAEWNYETLAIWCPGDLMVIPGWSAKFEKATELLRCDVPAHAWPVVSKRHHDAIVRFLNG